MTLRQLAAELLTLPTSTTWHLTDLAEALGKQKLFTHQSPQKLKALREHALVESAVSSNRIEGVEVDKARIATLVFGKSAFRDRDEEEVRGYRNALKLIHEKGVKLPISEATIKRLQKLCRGDIWDAGDYKEKDVDIVEKYPDGRTRVRFKTVPARQTPKATRVRNLSCALATLSRRAAKRPRRSLLQSTVKSAHFAWQTCKRSVPASE